MRRNDREITDSREILSIVNECKVIRLAMLDEQGLPLIIPLNFGYRFADGVFTFYCHSAREGPQARAAAPRPRAYPLKWTAAASCSPPTTPAATATTMPPSSAAARQSSLRVRKSSMRSPRSCAMAGREDTFTEEQARGVAVLAIRVRSLSAKAKKH